MTMGYVLLINIGHNSPNAVQPSFRRTVSSRLYATAVHQLALSWGGCGRGIHAAYRQSAKRSSAITVGRVGCRLSF